MFAVHARYRGRASRRADHVVASAAALSRLEAVGEVTTAGVEDIHATPQGPVGVTTLVLALLAAGDWAVAIAVCPPHAGAGAGMSAAARASAASDAATAALGRGGRAGQVQVRVIGETTAVGDASDDIAAAFTLLQHVISRRSAQGRQATGLMRAGWSQVEAAAELGVSKQAVNQRLNAAGWHAEEAGWTLAVHLLERAAQL
ncbi:DNA-binding protein [Corynebacterium sp. TAE3-ERU12]|uniref:DNA-binding protein n=1 Tax=Corynebacterium sp. TAE3-ERU12 TaxID=2849491 RepID=UPI001C43F56E|nr:DNA-binding protein [Corynebacterium sp. TAE3-ERU12]MBV7295449.1 DNA-binding protein [Corynebacterium sp. TAE3-ERU12]